jgi:hypothetical protein
MRLSMGAVIILALLPITFAVGGFYSAHFILSSPKRVDWVSLGAPPSSAVEFVEQSNLVRGTDGRIYWHNGNAWSLKSDETIIFNWETDEDCPKVVFPKGTIDKVQKCNGYSDDYYVILEDGTLWYYTTGWGDNLRSMQYVGKFIVKVIASVVGLAFGVGIMVLVGIMGRIMPAK